MSNTESRKVRSVMKRYQRSADELMQLIKSCLNEMRDGALDDRHYLHAVNLRERAIQYKRRMDSMCKEAERCLHLQQLQHMVVGVGGDLSRLRDHAGLVVDVYESFLKEQDHD